MITILGIDPGSRVTGYGVIAVVGNKLHYVASGCIVTQSTEMAGKLAQIFQGVTEVIQCYSPQEAAIEQVFVHQNASSALKLGQARGAAMVAMSNLMLPVAEYSARRVKQSVVGNGAADKTQVQHMIKCLLNLAGTLAADAADALAVAVCHAHTLQTKRATKRIKQR